MIVPPKPVRGDRVAAVSPSAGLPGILPRAFDLGLDRLRGEFGLVPVEYPTTRTMGASPADRAADLHAAFADPEIKAVIASIGGDDQVTVLPYLDAELLRANPKPFFGFSDNTCLANFLHRAGVVSYYGGMVMTAFGRSARMHPVTAASVDAALFTAGEYALTEVDAYGDVEQPAWDDPAFGTVEPALKPCEGWRWHGPEKVVEGRSWGGCLESLALLAIADRIAPVEEFAGGVLFVETSEEMPSPDEVYRILRSLGERGLLEQFPAAMVGRAKTWALDRHTTPEEQEEFRRGQREAVLRAFGEYAPDAMLVLDVDFGHTDPQQVIPYGGTVRVDGPARAITVTY